MTTNVGFEYAQAQAKYEAAKTPMEKMLALQEMRRYAPKHKGSENLLKDLTKKMGQLRHLMEKQEEQAKKAAATRPTVHVKKEGVGQICIIGPPNSGKSTLLNKLTGVEVEIASHQFTTTKPEVGMMKFRNALVQIVEVPAIIEGSTEGKASGTVWFSIIRNADAFIILTRNFEELAMLRKEFEKASIKINEEKPSIIINQSTQFRGITIAGKGHLRITEQQLVDFLKNLGIFNAEVILNEATTLEKVAQVLDEKIIYKKALLLDTFDETPIEKLKEEVFRQLGKILIYTKKPGEEADLADPMCMPEGTTAGEIPQFLHKDIAKNLKYVKVWGSTKFPGQRVQKEYVLQDGDVVEVYA